MSEMKPLLAIVLVLLLASGGRMARSAEHVTLTDAEGREIEAKIAKVYEDSVLIQRVSDGSIFDIPLDQLSPGSRDAVSAWEEQAGAAEDEGEWRTLTVVLPRPRDDIFASGLARRGREKRGAREWSLRLPVGCWVKANLYTRQRMLESLVPFRGEAERWEYTTRGPRVLLSKDGGPPEIVGVTLEEGTERGTWFAENGTPWAESLSIELQELGQIDRLGETPVPVAAICATNYALTDPEIASIAKAEPAALAIDLDYRLMPSLAHFEDKGIESCSLEFRNEPSEMEGRRLKDFPVDLPSLPRLKYFNNFFNVIPGNYADTLAEKTPAVRTLTISASQQKASFADFHGMERFPDLEALNLTWGMRTTVEELLKARNLKVLTLDNSGLPARGAGFSSFPDLEGLIEIQNTIGAFDENVMKRWADSGNMETLVEYEGYRAVDFGKLRDAEVLKLRRNTKRNDPFDIASLAGLEKLWSLKLDNATQAEVEAIASLPNAGQIEALVLYGGSFSDLSPLASLVNLRNLEVTRSDGGLAGIDVSLFPRLESFIATYLPELAEIRNLDSHPSIEYISIGSCPVLRSVGESYADTRLTGLRLFRLDQVTDLRALQGSGIRQLDLYHCDSLTEPLGFDQESLDYFLVYRCENLPERMPGQ